MSRKTASVAVNQKLADDPSRVRAVARAMEENPPMRAVVIDAVEARPEVRTVPAPVAPDDGVVVQVAATGLCRSDWHA